MQIKVTGQDIILGLRNSPTCCPVAMAMRRIDGRSWVIHGLTCSAFPF